MKRTLATISLAGFLAFTGIFLFVYLFRAFRLPAPAGEATVYVWHGDPMTRALLAAVLFAIGLILMLILAVARSEVRTAGSVKVRPDLWEWVTTRAEETNEAPERIVDRAISGHRDRLGGGMSTDR
jgi:hypothetical protein